MRETEKWNINTIYKLFKIENKNLNLNLDNLLTWVILLDFDWLTWARYLILLASSIQCLIFIGCSTVRFDLSDYKLLVIRQVKSDSLVLHRPD